MDPKVLKKQYLHEIIFHVFLPRILPSSISKYFEIIECLFLELIEDHLKRFLEFLKYNGKNQYFKFFLKISQIFSNWFEIQSSYIINSKALNAKLNDLIKNKDQDNTLPIYLIHQNSCLLIQFLNENHRKKLPLFQISCSSFQVSVESETIMSNSSDIIITIPSVSTYIPNESLIGSPSFSTIVSDLTNNPFDETMAHSKKKGESVQEIREVQDPKLVNEWLLYAISGDCPPSQTPKSITKKVRDDVIWHQAYSPFRRSGMWMCIKFVLHIYFCHFLEDEDGNIEGSICYKILMVDFMSDLIEFSKNDDSIDHDLNVQVIGKIARRLYKLNTLIMKTKNTELKEIFREVSKKSCKIINETKIRLLKEWNIILKNLHLIE